VDEAKQLIAFVSYIRLSCAPVSTVGILSKSYGHEIARTTGVARFVRVAEEIARYREERYQ